MKKQRPKTFRLSLFVDQDVYDGVAEVAEREVRNTAQVARIIVEGVVRSGHLKGLSAAEIGAFLARLAVARRPRVLDRRGLVAVPRLD